MAQRFGTTVEAIRRANPGVDPNNLQIGQVICILYLALDLHHPCAQAVSFTRSDQEILSSSWHSASAPLLRPSCARTRRGSKQPPDGQVICIPVPGPTPLPICRGFFYTIRPGDTYFLLAQRFGTTVEALIAANPGVDPNNLQVGQVICILYLVQCRVRVEPSTQSAQVIRSFPSPKDLVLQYRRYSTPILV